MSGLGARGVDSSEEYGGDQRAAKDTRTRWLKHPRRRGPGRLLLEGKCSLLEDVGLGGADQPEKQNARGELGLQ